MKSLSQDRTGVICENVILTSTVNLKENTSHGDLFRKLAILCKKVSIASVCEFNEWRGLSEIHEKYKCIFVKDRHTTYKFRLGVLRVSCMFSLTEIRMKRWKIFDLKPLAF